MKQPTAEDLGAAPGVAGARPVGSYEVDAYAHGAQKMAQAGERFGQAVARVGESEAEFAARRARAEFNTARTKAVTGLFGLRTKYATDPDYTTVKQRWIDDATKTVDGPAEAITDELTRLFYYDSLHAPLMQESRNISRHAFQGAADAHAAHREQLLQQVERSASTDPDDALSTAATDTVHSNIDDAVDKRFLAPDAALAEKKAAALRLTAAHYRNMATEDPARAIDELTAEESPHPLVQHLPPDTRDSLVTHAQDNLRARQIDSDRDASFAARNSARAAAATQANYVELALADTPGLAFRVANDLTLTPDARTRLLGTTERPTQPDPPPATSSANALKLIDRIRRDDGDTERITDPTAILEAFNRGELNEADYKFVVKQLEEARTPEGSLLAAKMRAFMFHFKPVVDPGRADADAVAAQQTFQMEQALAARVERMRGDHKDPNDLFDPTKPDYLTTPFDLLRPLAPQEPAEPSGQIAPPEFTPAAKDASPAQAPPPGQSEKSQEPTRPSSEAPNDRSRLGSVDRAPAAASRQAEAQPPSTSSEKDLSDVAVANAPASPTSLEGIVAHDAPGQGFLSSNSSDIGFIKDRLGEELRKIGIDPDAVKPFTDAVALLASSTAAARIPSPSQNQNIVAQRPDVADILSASADAIRGARAAARPPKGGKPKRPSRKSESESSHGSESKERHSEGAHSSKSEERNDAKHRQDERSEDRSKREPENRPSKQAIAPETPTLFDRHLTQADYDRRINSREYETAFYNANPELRGTNMRIHHAIPKALFVYFRGVIPIDELHALDNLRGIPFEKNNKLHLSIINSKWNAFMRQYQRSGTRPTMEEIREQVRTIDRDHGQDFMPPYKEVE